MILQTQAATDTHRPPVGSGPLRKARTSDMPKDNSSGRTPHKLSEVAYRFMTKKCRNTLAVPSSFNMRLMDLSALPPKVTCLRDHVFGLSASSLITSSECIHSYPEGDGKISLGCILWFASGQ